MKLYQVHLKTVLKSSNGAGAYSDLASHRTERKSRCCVRRVVMQNVSPKHAQSAKAGSEI